ncbi:MAG: hypothetical protein IT355_15770 [Gemmatimonadaceae bacterium]|jgi:hypothetical protein|nr:hypothetical protein [Gemmatimonadaceae bacterium]
MPNVPSVSARDMIAAVDQLCAENDGAFPAPRAVRDRARGGSQERAEAAILAVEIRQGRTPHLRGTLPSDFEAELPPAATIASLAPAVLSDLPCIAQTTAEQCFAAIGVAFKAQVDGIRTLYDAAVATFVEQTTALHARLTVAARHADDQERLAREETNRHAAERGELREQLSAAQSDVRTAERELILRAQMHDSALTDVRAAARVNDERQAKLIEQLTKDLAAERDACRTAERAVASLTALNDGLRAENARVTAELAVHVERAATASPQKRTRATAAAR